MLALGIQSTLRGFKGKCSSSAKLQAWCSLCTGDAFCLRYCLGKMVEDSSCQYGKHVLLRATAHHGCMLLIMAKMLIFSWAESTSSFCF